MNENENIGVSFDHLNLAPSVDMPKERLPKWLVIKINEYEDAISPLNCVKFYRGKWNTRTVYLLFSLLHSCLLCDLYYEDGEKVDLGLNGEWVPGFTEKSTNWVMLYKVGNCSVQCK
jgi:hypothetical protein